MATNHTQNYALNLWEPEDRFLRTEFNENSEKLDAALKAEADERAALAQAISEKVDTAAMDTLNQAMAKKADASELTALTQTISGKADAAALTALTKKVDGKAEASAVTALSKTVSEKADALAALTKKVDGKADASTVTTLTQTVSEKADASALTALTKKVDGKAEASTVTALAQTVSEKADAAALTALAKKVDGKAEASTVTALAQTVSTKADAAALSVLAQSVSGITSDDLLFDLKLTESSSRIVIPLTAEVRGKYRKLVLYSDLKTKNTTSASLFLNGTPQIYSVMVSDGVSAAAYFSSLYTARTDYANASSFSRVEFYLTAPRACSLCASTYSYQHPNATDDVRSGGILAFFAARTLTWDQVTQMDIAAELLAGSWVKLYGVR